MTRYEITLTVSVPEGCDEGCADVARTVQAGLGSWCSDLGWDVGPIELLLADPEDHECDCECAKCVDEHSVRDGDQD